MERINSKAFKYWIELVGKGPRKRKESQDSMGLAMVYVNEPQPQIDGLTAARHLQRTLGLRGARYRVMRTVVEVTHCDDGGVVHMMPLFDVNLTCLEQGELTDIKK